MIKEALELIKKFFKKKKRRVNQANNYVGHE
jgi:hypothetical protein